MKQFSIENRELSLISIDFRQKEGKTSVKLGKQDGDG